MSWCQTSMWLKTPNHRALTSEAHPCPTSCALCQGRACTRVIYQVIRRRTAVFACLNSWRKISLNQSRSERRSRSPIRLLPQALVSGLAENSRSRHSDDPAARNMIVITQPNATEEQIQRIVTRVREFGDRKSTRLNSSHRCISYAVFCLKKKTT